MQQDIQTLKISTKLSKNFGGKRLLFFFKFTSRLLIMIENFRKCHHEFLASSKAFILLFSGDNSESHDILRVLHEVCDNIYIFLPSL